MQSWWYSTCLRDKPLLYENSKGLVVGWPFCLFREIILSEHESRISYATICLLEKIQLGENMRVCVGGLKIHWATKKYLDD